MTHRSKKLALALAFGIGVALWALPADAAKRVPTVTCTRNGETVDTVSTNAQFAVSGEGFRAGLPVDVCFGDRDCRLRNVDASGRFYQVRTIYQPGSYTVTVKQARNSRLNRWDVRAVAILTVTE